MSEAPSPHRVLHLIVEGFPPVQLEELTRSIGGAEDVTEIFQLTEANAREALGKIFDADTVATWSDLKM